MPVEEIVGARAKANAKVMQAAAVASLTEATGAIGGTNDGNLPDLTTPTDALNAEAIREVADKLNDLMAALRTAGLLGT